MNLPLLGMLDYTRLPPGALWTGGYGDPARPEEAAWLAAYLPYHNVDPDAVYPPVLLMTSTADYRVRPDHLRKMAAWMQKMDQTKTLFFEDTEGGHSSAGDCRPTLQCVYLFLQRALTAGRGIAFKDISQRLAKTGLRD